MPRRTTRSRSLEPHGEEGVLRPLDGAGHAVDELDVGAAGLEVEVLLGVDAGDAGRVGRRAGPPTGPPPTRRRPRRSIPRTRRPAPAAGAVQRAPDVPPTGGRRPSIKHIAAPADRRSHADRADAAQGVELVGRVAEAGQHLVGVLAQRGRAAPDRDHLVVELHRRARQASVGMIGVRREVAVGDDLRVVDHLERRRQRREDRVLGVEPGLQLGQRQRTDPLREPVVQLRRGSRPGPPCRRSARRRPARRARARRRSAPSAGCRRAC